MKKCWRGSLAFGLLSLLVSAGFAAAAVVGAGTADKDGQTSICVESDRPIRGDDLRQLLDRNLTVSSGQIQSTTIEENQAKILVVNTDPGKRVDAEVPGDVASANELADCKEAGAAAAAGGGFIAVGPPGGAFSQPGVAWATLAALGLGGIFGGLCAAGELGCGGGGGKTQVLPPQPPPPVQPTPRPPPRPVSPFR